MKRLIVALAVFASVSCATFAPQAPPGLSPQVQAKFYATYAIKDLDVIRDFANDANKTTPPLVSNATLLLVVDWHESIVRGIHAAPDGWKALAATALDELPKRLAPADAVTFRPYIEAAKTFVKEAK